MSEQEKFYFILDAIRKRASEILPAGSRVALYGSRARGEGRIDSDWDLHIIVPDNEKPSLSIWEDYGWPFEQLGFDLDEWITPRVYSVQGWLKREFLPFYKNVEKDKLIIFQS